MEPLAAAALPESPSELHDLVEGLGAIVWRADARDFRFNFVSPNAEAVLGYPAEQWLAEPDFWVSHVHPEDRDEAVHVCTTATARGEDHRFEYRAIAAGGRVVWMRDIVRVIVDKDSHPCELRGLMIDITEQKQAEQALRESEERFRQLAENIHEIFWMVEAGTRRVLYVSPAFEQVWGRSCESVYENSRSFLDGVHPADRAMIVQAYEERLYRGEAVFLEYRVIRPDGELRWIWGRSYPVFDAEGRIYRFVGIAEDITLRKEGEAVLRESEGRFRNLFEGSPIAAAVIGLDLRINRANQALCKLVGRQREELETLSCQDFTHPDDVAADHAAFLRMFAGEIPRIRLEKRYLRPDGEIVWVDLAAALVRSEDGRPLYALGMAEDVTMQHRAEERLRELSGRLIRLQDEERRRIARELHDSTGQNLAALQLNLSHLGETPLKPELAKIVSDSLDLTEHMIREIRTLSYLLHPPLLDELGLDSAIRAYISGFSERSGIEVSFDSPLHLGRIGKDLELAIFRIIQESLTNMQRHSGSKRGWISMDASDQEIVVRVLDEGTGLATGEPAGSLPNLGVGISGMRERARRLGGQVEITSDAGGYAVQARFPLGDR